MGGALPPAPRLTGQPGLPPLPPHPLPDSPKLIPKTLQSALRLPLSLVPCSVTSECPRSLQQQPRFNVPSQASLGPDFWIRTRCVTTQHPSCDSTTAAVSSPKPPSAQDRGPGRRARMEGPGQKPGWRAQKGGQDGGPGRRARTEGSWGQGNLVACIRRHQICLRREFLEETVTTHHNTQGP